MKNPLKYFWATRNYEGTYIAIALLIQQILSFLTVLTIARILGASAYGSFAFVKSIMTVCVTFGPMGLNIGLLKTLTRFDKDPSLRAHHFRSFRIFVFICNIAVPAVAYILAVNLVNIPASLLSAKNALLVALISLPFASDIALFGAYYRVTARVIFFAKISLIGQNLLAAFLIVSSALLFHDYVVVTAANTFSIVAIQMVLCFHYLREHQRHIQVPPNSFVSENFFSTIQQSLWMACSTIAYTLLRNLDVIMLGGFTSPSKLGSYSLLSTLSYVIFVVPLALSQSLGPSVARAYENSENYKLKEIFSAYFKHATIFASFLAAGIAAYGDRLSLLLGDTYQMSPSIASLLAVGQLTSALLGPTGFALSMTGYHRHEFVLLISATFVMAALLYLILPLYGPMGAASVSLFIYFITNGIRYFLVRLYIGVWLARWIDLSYPVFAFVLAFLCRNLFGAIDDGLASTVLGCLAYTTIYLGCFLCFSSFTKTVAKIR